MALRLLESFDGVATYAQFINNITPAGGSPTAPPSAANKWWPRIVTSSGVGGDYSLVPGVTGNCIKRGSSGVKQNALHSRSQSLGISVLGGVRYKPSTLATGRYVCALFTDAGADRFHITANVDGSLTAASNTTTATSVPGILSAGVSSYIEFWYILSDGAGYVEVKVNGFVVLQKSGDTRASGADNEIRGMSIGEIVQSTYQYEDEWDDIYLVTAAGGENTSYLGDTKVRCGPPDGNGNVNQFINSAGTTVNNYSYVDEQSVNDSDFVSASADGDKDLYTFTDLAITGVIKGVQHVVRSGYLNSGDPKDLLPKMRESGTEVTTGNELSLSTFLRENFVIRETSVAGTFPMTQTELNNTEFGYEQKDE